MAMMYTSEGWMEVKFPPFLDLNEVCRKQDAEDERKWREEKQGESEGDKI